MKIQSLVILLLLNALLAQEFNDLVCSGFVEFGSDNQDGVDFSSIEINLYTLDGQLVEKSNCANNGFYLLPIHDLKDFYVRVTSKDEILQFKPNQAHLEFARKSLEQAKQICDTSINFKWSGFQLSDRVHVFQEDTQEIEASYLSGIELDLIGSDGLLISQTLTDSDGQFTFNDIMPGRLTIRPSANNQHTFYAQNYRMDCEVLWKKGKSCQGQLILQGFDISGSLHNENEALSNFKVELEALDSNLQGIELPDCQGNKQYLCTTTTQSDGSFRFSAVPLGRYQLNYKVQGELEESIIEIEPEQVEIQVTGAPLHINQQLLVNKLSINGRVADSRGVGIDGVKIYLDGQEQTTTDIDGNYVLSKVKTGVYTLEGYHNHLIFEPLNNLKLSLGLKTVPNLQLKYLHLCGQINLNTGNSIQLGDDTQFSNLKIVVYLENQNEKSEKRTTPVLREEGYRYCFEARPGKYLIYPIVAQPEKGKDIIWQPKSREVDLLDQPELNVNFERKIVILGGSVQFLSNIDELQIEATHIRLYSVKEPSRILQEQYLRATDRSYASFQFENILHGSYQVSIHNPLLCFKQNIVPLVITAESASDVQFNQNGYSVNYRVNQQVPVTLIPKNTPHPKETVNLTPSGQKICVPIWDDYIITVDDCYQSEPQSFTYKISNPDQLIQPLIQKIRVSGRLNLGTVLSNLNSDHSLLKDLASAIKIEVQQTLSSGVVERLYADVSLEENIYHFELYAKQGSSLHFKPYFIEDVTVPVDNLLFEPRSRTLKVGSDCITTVVRFELNTGFVFQGFFEEPIDNVQITVLSNGSELVEEITSSSERFKLGPYIDSAEYTLRFEKEGYRFQQEQTRNNNIVKVAVKVERLASLRISITDEKGAPLPQVTIFISTISKTNNVRITNQTNDEGVFQSTNFAQGEYMVKAYMKEYMFEPSSKTAILASGSLEDIRIVGKKVAFSIFGKVQDFNKDGVEGISVEAYSLNNAQGGAPKETTTTDKYGAYRIRGLEPLKKYQLKVRYEQAPQGQVVITPQQYDLSVGKEDMHNKDFIIFQKQKVFVVQGRLLIDDTYTKEEQNLQQIVSFEVYAESNLEVPLTNVRKLQFHRYYEVELPEPQDIVLVVTVEKEKEKGDQQVINKVFNHTVKRAQFIKEGRQQHNFQLSKQQTSEQKVPKNTSIAMPLFMIFLVIVGINFDKAWQVVQRFRS